MDQSIILYLVAVLIPSISPLGFISPFCSGALIPGTKRVHLQAEAVEGGSVPSFSTINPSIWCSNGVPQSFRGSKSDVYMYIYIYSGKKFLAITSLVLSSDWHGVEIVLATVDCPRITTDKDLMVKRLSDNKSQKLLPKRSVHPRLISAFMQFHDCEVITISSRLLQKDW